ncbi:MAG: ImmA/IrrE family metallo-endopeptidase [Bacteroidota bacterium]
MPFSLPLDRSLLSPPGDTIQETIDALGMTQAELAQRMGRPKEKINELIKGKAPLTMDTAIMLERVLNIPVSFWTNRESAYRETLARIEEQEALEQDLIWLDLFPLKVMHQRGIITTSKKSIVVVRELLLFFGFASSSQWNDYYLNTSDEVSFRISLRNTPNPGAVAVWLRLGEKKIQTFSLPTYNEKAFRAAMKEFRAIAKEQPDDFLSKIQLLAATYGVAVVFTPSLPNAKISGAARWIGPTPLIQLSDLYKTNDQFWFSFFHESCHILEHSKKEIFLEKLEGTAYNEAKENEANEFAANWLIPHAEYAKWTIDNKFFNADMIRNFAERIGIHPGIVVGRLQHDGKLKPAYCNDLKVVIKF